MIKTIDPTTGEEIATYETMKADEVQAVIERVDASARAWRAHTDFGERGRVLRKVAGRLRERRGELAALMAKEMGKPLSQGESEIDKCAWVCEHYAEHAARYLAPEPVDADHDRSYVAYRPLGVVLAVMPWNYPFWQVFRFAAPALMAGNGALLKHSANTTGCALALGQMLADAGAPFATLRVEHDAVEAVLDHAAVRAVTLTGSTRAGRAVASMAAERLKKQVLELGGSDAYVVLADADLDSAIEICAKARLTNGGQSCIAAKRFVVVESVHDRFVEGLVERMRNTKMGPPTEDGVEIGPQARRDLRDSLHEQVQDCVKAGATLALGGEVPDGPGAFYPPTVLVDVVPGMPAYDEELFGPVAAVIRAEDEEDAIRIANDSPYGLGAAVFTADLERGERIARDRLEAGACFVNAQVASDPRLPFGGVKDSGYGRELGPFGIREFVNVKAIAIG